MRLPRKSIGISAARNLHRPHELQHSLWGQCVKATTNDKLRLSILAALSVTAAPTMALRSAYAADAPPPTADEQTPTEAQGASAAAAGQDTNLETIVVTGSTSKRTLLDASVDVTPVTAAEIEQKAPRNTADVLQLIPGVFVESTAGPVSNNYSVRGLPGGGQTFITLVEDGMPVLYGGGGADEYFQNDITIEAGTAAKPHQAPGSPGRQGLPERLRRRG